MSNIKLTEKAPESYKKSFEENSYVSINDFLDKETADRLHRFLHDDIPDCWWSVSLTPYKELLTHRTVDCSKEFMEEGIQSVNEANSNNKFSYYFYRATKHNNACNCIICLVMEKIKSPEVLDFISKIVGKPLVGPLILFASKYTSDCFLSIHTDKDRGEIAFVYNITKNWRPQYGANLHILEENCLDNKVVIAPKFNSLSIFDVSGEGRPHFVSQVLPHVKEKRLAISGWFS
jgi:Rps23 Pro-64 3,4-dihydroxylase Tpa1-like proline 4-hydroxylase